LREPAAIAARGRLIELALALRLGISAIILSCVLPDSQFANRRTAREIVAQLAKDSFRQKPEIISTAISIANTRG
jgi:hypothetical protein